MPASKQTLLQDEQIWDRWLIHSKKMFLDNQTVKFYRLFYRLIIKKRCYM